ncbi:MAG: gluconokinase [Alicyclobacillus sp.]|nr:gluconokinase [Alicyclobacillus sp.]
MDDRICTVALDIGTTSLKAVAYAVDGTPLTRASVRVQTDYLEDGGVVQDVEAIYESAVTALLRTADAAALQGYRVAAVGLSAAMHSLIPISADNEPLAPAMTWLDQRAADEAVALWHSHTGPTLYARTGTPIHAMAPLTKVRWLAQHRPELFRRAVRFASIKEYVWYRWFAVWEIDISMAGATGFFDVREHHWDAGALDYAGICADQLSTIVPTRWVRRGNGEPRFAGTPFAETVGFCIGSSDGVLATLAADAIRPEVVVVTMGTSLAVRSGTAAPVTDAATRQFCYPLDDARYVVGAPSNNGGVVLDWLVGNVLGVDAADAGERLEALLPVAGLVRADNLFCIPYVSGERAPLWNERASMSIVGLRLEHRREHVVRAVVEGILFNAYWLATSIQPTHRRERVVLSGKLFSLPWVQQLCADLFGLPVIVQSGVDGATLGAAVLANAALGLPEIPIAQTLTESVSPTAAAKAKWAAKYRQYRALCDVLAATER